MFVYHSCAGRCRTGEGALALDLDLNGFRAAVREALPDLPGLDLELEPSARRSVLVQHDRPTRCSDRGERERPAVVEHEEVISDHA